PLNSTEEHIERIGAFNRRTLIVHAPAAERVHFVKEDDDLALGLRHCIEELADVLAGRSEIAVDQALGADACERQTEASREVMRERGLAATGRSIEQRRSPRLDTDGLEIVGGSNLGQPLEYRRAHIWSEDRFFRLLR